MSGGARPLALVTGGAKRVGHEVALTFARSGFDVCITFRRSEQAASDTIDEIIRILGEPGHCRALQVDLADEGGVEKFARAQAGTLPRLDVLVHNASAYEPGRVGEIEASGALRQYKINALSPLLLSQAFAPLLSASPMHGGGAIVSMHDMHALGRPRSDYAAYSMSKAALGEMTRTLARALAPRVRVNAVAPGVVEWPSGGREADASVQDEYLKRVPLGRAGTAREAAEVVRWLALDAHYITGEIIRLDGGRWLA